MSGKGRDKIDSLVDQEFKTHSAKSWFKIEPVARAVLVGLRPVPKLKGVELEPILLDHIKRRFGHVSAVR